MKEKDIGEKVELEYGQGWGWKRTATVIALAAAIVGGATYGAMQDYTPQVRTEHRIETREKLQYEPSTSYVSKE